MPPPPAGNPSGWLLGGRYRVRELIGTGGMAEVFRAHDELLARDVAVKVFRSRPGPPDSTSGVERQQLELQALARLNHPNLITLFDGSIGASDGPAFLVMELINGPSLAARIAEGPLPELQARDIGAQIADALAYVHGDGMVHRDVKPGNILLGTDRTAGDGTVRARLSDFGIVRLLGSERLTSAEFTLGTASYLAPEQARGSDVGPPADIYALGLVLIEALSGVRSYDGPPLEVVMARLAHGPDLPRDLPAPWPALLAAMTALDPDGRPSAGQVADTLRGRTLAALAPPILMNPADAAEAPTVGLAAAGLAPSAVTPPAGTAPATDGQWADGDDLPRNRRTGWLLAAAAVVAVLGIAAFLLLRPVSHTHSPTDSGPGAVTHHPSGSHTGRSSSGQVAPANDLGGQSGSGASNTKSGTHTSPAHGGTAPRTGASSAPGTATSPPSSSGGPPASTSASTSSTPTATATTSTPSNNG